MWKMPSKIDTVKKKKYLGWRQLLSLADEIGVLSDTEELYNFLSNFIYKSLIYWTPDVNKIKYQPSFIRFIYWKKPNLNSTLQKHVVHEGIFVVAGAAKDTSMIQADLQHLNSFTFHNQALLSMSLQSCV